MPGSSTVIGAPIPRLEGADKVSGRALYTADVSPPGTLAAKILRSPYAHARIVSIDASAAWQVPGVKAVLTGKDIVGHRWGRFLRDMPVLCWDVVRFVGDRVAAVAAETADAAEQALQLIEVEYEELPAVFDPLEAMQPDAPLLHPDFSEYQDISPEVLIPDTRNGLSRLTWQKGDVDAGFAEADLVLEHTFYIPSRHQGYLEPHAGIVAIDEAGRIQVWTASKSPFGSRNQLAKSLGIQPEQILVHPIYVGGDFGGKGDALDLPIAYFLAKQAGRPVRIIMSYLEELLASNPSHESIITIRTGIKRDGRMVARYLRAIHNTGAYGCMKPLPNVAIGGAVHAGGPYRIDNTFFEAIQVYTNTVPAGFFRAPGGPQVNFAAESHTDLIAQALGMDVAEFRLRNLVEEGDENAVGEKLNGVHARETLEAALQAAHWRDPKPGVNYGRGIAMYERHVGAGPSSAELTVEDDGSVTIISPTIDQGGGIHTVLQQIVSEEMQIPLDQVRVVVGDTDSMPPDQGVGGMRITNANGHAALQAIEELQGKLRERAGEILGAEPEQLSYDEGVFYRSNDGGRTDDGNRALSLAELAAQTADAELRTGRAKVEMPMQRDIACFAAQIAEVEVDPETGHIRVHRFVSAHDVSTVINPIAHQGQIDGGVIQGLGMALTEDLAVEEGRVTSLHLGDYKLPSAADIPELETVLVHSEGGPGPYEAKAIAEMTNCAPPAAVANAIADAVGVRLMELPMTAERVYRALQDK